MWFHTEPVVGRKTLETSRDFVVQVWYQRRLALLIMVLVGRVGRS